MAAELFIEHVTGKTVGALVRDSAGLVWNTSGTPAFEAYNASNIASYKVAMTEQGATGAYFGTFPVVGGSGADYRVTYYELVGSNLAVTDTKIGVTDIWWDGLDGVIHNVGARLLQIANIHTDVNTIYLQNNIIGNTVSTINGTLNAGVVLHPTGLDAVLIESSITPSASLVNDAASQLSSINARQALALCISALSGILSGATGTTITIKAGGKTTSRIVATVDSNGNRSAAVITVPT